ncbi:glutaredoxin [Savitreella phatthalungensis]
MTVIEALNDAHFESVIKDAGDKVVCINFWAAFAAPSVQMNAVFDELATRFATVVFIKVDAEELEDVAETFDVEAVPYFVLFRQGEVLSKVSGANPQELQAALQRYGGGDAAKPIAAKTTPPAAQQAAAPVQATPSTTNQAQEEESPEDLQKRLDKLTKAAQVMLFMKGTPQAPQCGFSRTLVGLLREEGIKYGFFNILADDSVRQGLKKFSDWPTFPQLYVGGEFVGGLDVVREMIESGEMADVLKEHDVETVNA